MTEIMENGEVNGHHNGHHKETEEERRIRKEKERKSRENETEEERRIRKEKEKRRETSEERRIRKDKERKARENETEEERRIRKEKEKRKETEEERAARKEREKGEKRKETEEERAARKEKERKERKNETEEERRARKEKEKGYEKRRETSEERRIRKEKEKKAKENETEEERRIRKEKERKDKEKRQETEEERAARKERERKERKHETEEERAARKERERKERKEREKKSEVKAETMELGDDYFAAEEAKLESKQKKVKEEEDDEQNGYYDNGDHMKEEDDEDTKEGIIKEEIPMEESDDDAPLAKRKKANKRKAHSDEDSDDEPLSKKKSKKAKKKHSDYEDEEEEEDYYDKPKKSKPKPSSKSKAKTKNEPVSPTKKMTKKEKEAEAEKQVWKWWEDDNQLPEGVKWRFLEHKGPMLAPDYEPLPKHVRFWYDGKVIKLSEESEECATFYGRMLDHDYTTKEVFNKNFFKDWRKTMTHEEKERIRDLSKCDFSEINEHFKKVSEERKNRSKEEKKAEKEKNEQIVEEYGFCIMDGHKERIGNFRIEPPGLFRGRGEHPKQGMIKRRTMPEDVIINCSKDSEVPEPPYGRKWKKVQHDNTVTWLASWTENIQGQIKYVMLNPSSRLKGEKDWQKYEKARKLKGEIDRIRDEYMADMKSKEMRIRQRAVALYFIDKLALRAGNEKDEDQADTVGCCSLRVEHVELVERRNDRGEEEFVVEFDFLGKDSIRYQNSVVIEKKVFKNLKLFKENKKDNDDLFDRLNTSILNQYLQQLMEGLTAKVFRTYNASFTLQQQLDELTDPSDNVAAKMLSYNRANREVAVLCNHQRAVPKTFDKSMENLAAKIEAKQDAIKDAEKKFKSAKKAYKNGGSQAEKANLEKCKKTLERLMEQLEKLEIQRTDRDENKTIALGTSKLNYLDPRISVSWCKKHEVPIEKVYNKTQREKFRWAIDMIMNTEEEYHF